MAKITGNNPPLSDWEYQDATGDDHFLGEFYRLILKEAYPSPADPDTDITGLSPRGARPSEQGEGTPAQAEIRDAFRSCAGLWTSLPEKCPEEPTDPPTTSLESVWEAKQNFGVVCSYYDLFMRCCINFALAHGGDMPDGDCFPCLVPCTCEGVSIGYTTQGMQVSEEQTLFVVGYEEGCKYEWAIIEGGGKLSATEGIEVIYTAPDTNPECALNSTITLSCNNEVCDILKIAVNAAIWEGRFVRIVEQIASPAGGDPLCSFSHEGYLPNTGECPNDDYIGLVGVSVRVSYYNCDGSLWSNANNPCEAAVTVSTSYFKNDAGKFYLCYPADKEEACAIAMQVINYQCYLGGLPWADYVAASPEDFRNEYMIEHGCCPEQLL